MTLFALPVLPQVAYRRHWLYRSLIELGAAQRFMAILKAFAPAEAARVDRGHPATLYLAVLRAVGKLIPVHDVAWLGEDAFFDEFDSLADSLHKGIPVYVFGWHPEHSTPALDLAAARMHGTSPKTSYELNEGTLLDWIMTWWKPGEGNPAGPIVPRGRKLIGPWVGVGDVAAYVLAATDLPWLDVDFESQDYGGPGPNWSVGNIRAMTRDWQKTKPVWDRIVKLAQYVDAKPRQRMPLLDGALRRDPAAMLQITRPLGKGEHRWPRPNRSRR